MKIMEQAYNAMRNAIIGLQMIWHIVAEDEPPNEAPNDNTRKNNMQWANTPGRLIKTMVCAALTQSTAATRQEEFNPLDTRNASTALTTHHPKTPKTIQVTFDHGEELVRLLQQPWEGEEFWPTKDLQGAELKQPTKTA